MVDSQLDDDPVIQNVLLWAEFRDTLRSGRGGPGNDIELQFVPVSVLKAELTKPGKVESILEALFVGPQYSIPDAEYIRAHYLRPFVILICIGSGRMIHHFVQHESLRDDHLPFKSEPKEFPKSSTTNIWASFHKKQWVFCPMRFENNMNSVIDQDEILPITIEKDLGGGGSSTTQKISVHEDYNELNPRVNDALEASTQPRNLFVIKTFRTQDARAHFEAERKAFTHLKQTAGRPPPNIIGFHGSFSRGDTLSIVLEYADLGTLDDFMKQHQPPSSPEDTILFWSNFSDVMLGIVTIHGTLESNKTEPQIMLGWHQDLKPSNILVKTIGSSPYDCRFMVADLGLSHFKKASHRGTADRDLHGAHDYAAPEAFRSDFAMEECVLSVKQDADIWSIGCIYSETATWVAHGWNTVLEYRRRRGGEFYQSTKTDGQCFHNEWKVLQAVNQIHTDIKRARRHHDHITPMILDRLVWGMLIVRGSRLEAKYVYEESKRIIREAQTDMSNLSPITVNGFGHPPLRVDHQPRAMPPNLPSRRELGPKYQDLLINHPQCTTLPEGNYFSHNPQSCETSHNKPYGVQNDLNEVSQPSGNYLGHFDGRGERPFSSHHSHLGHPHRQAQESIPEALIGLPNGPLHNNRFSVQAERGVGRAGGNFNHQRRETRNIPLEDSSYADHVNPNSFHTSAVEAALLASPVEPTPRPSHSSHSHRLVSPTTEWSIPRLRRHPWLSVDKGLGWMRCKDTNRNHRLEGEELLDSLRNNLDRRDHALLIDDAASTAPYRPEMRNVCELISYMVKDYDPNGLDLYFTSSRKRYKPSRVSSLLDQLDAHPSRGVADMRERFGTIIEKYQQKFGRRTLRSVFLGTPKVPRKFTLYVFTDGVWQLKCNLIPTIKALVRTLIEHGLPNKHVGIQFIRFGDDARGIARLKELDSELNLDLDIIDTTEANGNVWKMLFGPVNDDFDDDP